jgi:triacylglycerol esterase/lipase EstA (alpha/beta hydrolase family)
MPFRRRGLVAARAAIAAMLCWLSAMPASARDVPSCPAPEAIGAAPTRLLVIVPATTQGSGHWQSFLQALKKDPQSADLAVLVFDHHVGFMSLGSAYDVATQLEACIAEKALDERYRSITLIGHSIGGMFVRKAYLSASGATRNAKPAPGGWAAKVDRILLFTSVNKGIRAT